jgi:hypothetical protein
MAIASTVPQPATSSISDAARANGVSARTPAIDHKIEIYRERIAS